MDTTKNKPITSPTALISRGIKSVMLGTLLAVAGTVAISAWAQPSHGEAGGFGGPGLFAGSPEHALRGIDRLLDAVKANDVQRAQIKEIATAAAVDFKAQHEAGNSLRDQGLQLFSATVVDARAVETLRQQVLAQHDQASKRISQALIEISTVLTPEQRVTLVDRLKQRTDKGRPRGPRAASQPLS